MALEQREYRNKDRAESWNQIDLHFNSTQMYKKRLTKWGFEKSSKRSASSNAMTEKVAIKPSRQYWNDSSLSASPELCEDDNLTLLLLTSVRAWSASFYESLQPEAGQLAPTARSCSGRSEEISFAFKLVIDMFERGQGMLAGKLARKAFLILEDLLLLDGPAAMWNLLEMMHHIVACGHLQLFQLLSSHLSAIAYERMPKTHPLPAVLRALGNFITHHPDLAATLQHQSTTPSLSPHSLEGTHMLNGPNSCASREVLLSTLQRAWTLNAEMLFGQFDSRLFQLYIRINWDSCSIEPPTAIVSATKWWLERNPMSQVPSDRRQHTQTLIEVAPFEHDQLLQRVFSTPTESSPPTEYQLLREISIETLRRHVNEIIGRGAGSAGDNAMLLRILASLLTAQTFEDWPRSRTADGDIEEMSMISRGQAGNVACAVRTLIQLISKCDEAGATPDTVDMNRSIVALLEYANAEIDPRVIREMCFLEAALTAAGRDQEAREVAQRACRCLEEYVQHISPEP